MNTAPPPAPSARSRLAALTVADCLVAAGRPGTGVDDGAASHRAGAGAGGGRTRTALVTHGDAVRYLVRTDAEAAAPAGRTGGDAERVHRVTAPEAGLYRTNGNVSGGGTEPVLTGPAFVTEAAADADAVRRFAAHGTR